MVAGRRLQTKMRSCNPKVAHLRGLFRHYFLLLLPEKLSPKRIRGDSTNEGAQDFQPKEARLNNVFERAGWDRRTISPCHLRCLQRTISSDFRGKVT